MDSLSKLAPSFIEGLGESEAFLKRKLIYRRDVINFACLLILAYTDYARMMMHRSMLVKRPSSYKVVEKIVGVFNAIFGQALTPDKIIRSDDECANKSLDNYKSYCQIVDMFVRCGMDKDKIDDFCSQLYHPENEKYAKLTLKCLLHYEAYCGAILFYISGGGTYERTQNAFKKHYTTLGLKRKNNAFRDFVRDMRTILDLFYEVYGQKDIFSEEKEGDSEA